MENAIIGEHLKGLYTAITSISPIPRLYSEAETAARANAALQTSDRLSLLTTELTKCTCERDELTQELIDAVTLRNDMKVDRARISNQASERISALQERLKTTEDECDRLRLDAQKYEKRFKDLSEEYEKLRNRLHQYRLRRRQFGEVEEKVCKHCQKVYTEPENYNWSCRSHTGEYSSDMWWCCGRHGKDAEGCKMSKHENKEEDGALAVDEEDLELARLASVQCAVLDK